ncbi:hypothetical protein [Pseudomonas sp. M30-35]|uniref:hypothetical protein n=1 Tax=Pseudomonas sp. M30-35 TaxID=1981174 RepID=UPI000B3C83FE|nr:hypothetical protein [Pseudomonas sp. M30-35]ARU87092.1 hypothetical protein B9K09_03430 [Pseudomonas sp. M30-35]
MIGPSVRYDTLVIRGATGTEVPRTTADGEVVSWAQGHMLAQHGPLEEFVKDLADGVYEDYEVRTIQAKASHALQLSRLQRFEGWI